jgi:hypothetical protein
MSDFTLEKEKTAYGTERVVEFLKRPVLLKQQSLDEGEDIFKEMIYVKIHNPDPHARDKVSMYPIYEKEDPLGFKTKYKKEWDFFSRMQAKENNGTDLSFVFSNSSIIKILNHAGILTAEKLCNTTDEDLLSIQDRAVNWKKKAIKYLDEIQEKKKDTTVESVVDQNNILMKQNEILMKELQDLKSRMDHQIENPKKRRQTIDDISI